MKKRFGIKLVALLLVAAALLGCLTTAFAASKKQSAAKTETLVVYAADYPVEEDGWYSTMEEVAVYLTLYEKLPGNFISKYDAENLGWDNRKGNLDKVAPGCSIGVSATMKGCCRKPRDASTRNATSTMTAATATANALFSPTTV